MFPIVEADGDALLFHLLGPVKSAAVRGRTKAVHLADVKIPKPRAVKSAVYAPPAAPGMPMQFPYGVGLTATQPPPQPAPAQKIPVAALPSTGGPNPTNMKMPSLALPKPPSATIKGPDAAGGIAPGSKVGSYGPLVSVRTKAAADPSLLGQIGQGDLSGAWGNLKTQGQGLLNNAAAEAGQHARQGFMGNLKMPGDMMGPGVSDFLDKNRWANYAAWGAPIGAGIGLLGGMFNRKKKRNALGDALTGGLLGAAGGGLLGAATDMYGPEPPAAPAPPAAKPAPIEVPKASPNPIVNAAKTQALDFGATPESLKARDDLNRTAGLATGYQQFLSPQGQEKLKPLADLTGAVGHGQATLNAATPFGENNLLGRAANAGARRLGFNVSTPEQRNEMNATIGDRFDTARTSLGALGDADRLMSGPTDDPFRAVGHGVNDLLANQAVETLRAAPGMGPGDAPPTLESQALPAGALGRNALTNSAGIGAARGASRLTGLTAATGSPTDEARRILATQNGTAKERGFFGRLAHPLEQRPLAPENAGPGLVDRLKAQMNSKVIPGTGQPVTGADVTRDLKGGGPARTELATAAQGPLKSLMSKTDGLTGPRLAESAEFVDRVRTVAGLSTGPASQAEVKNFLTTGRASTPALTQSLERALEGAAAAVDHQVVPGGGLGRGPVRLAPYVPVKGPPRTVAGTLGAGAKLPFTGAGPLNPYNLLLGSGAAIGRRQLQQYLQTR